MKKIILILAILTFIISCSGTKKLQEQYLIEDLKNDTLDNVLIKEKLSFKKAFFVFQGINFKPISDLKAKHIQELNNKHLNDERDYWSEKDFEKVKFSIIKEDSIDTFLKKREASLKNKYFADKFNLFYISKLFFYNENKNVFFYITKVKHFNYRVYDEVIIMEKIKGKWVVVEKIQNSDLD